MTISAVTRDVGVIGGFAGAWMPFCAQGLEIVIGSHCNRVSGGGAGAVGTRLGLAQSLPPQTLDVVFGALMPRLNLRRTASSNIGPNLLRTADCRASKVARIEHILSDTAQASLSSQC